MLDAQKAGIVGKDSIDLNDLIGQDLIQDVQIEYIPNDQLLQIGEHFLRSHTTVSREDRMGAAAAYRERTA